MRAREKLIILEPGKVARTVGAKRVAKQLLSPRGGQCGIQQYIEVFRELLRRAERELARQRAREQARIDLAPFAEPVRHAR